MGTDIVFIGSPACFPVAIVLAQCDEALAAMVSNRVVSHAAPLAACTYARIIGPPTRTQQNRPADFGPIRRILVHVPRHSNPYDTRTRAPKRPPSSISAASARADISASISSARITTVPIVSSPRSAVRPRSLATGNSLPSPGHPLPVTMSVCATKFFPRPATSYPHMWGIADRVTPTYWGKWGRRRWKNS